MSDTKSARIAELEAQLASFTKGVKVSVPTHAMEQEFQNQYRRGYNAAADKFKANAKLAGEIK